MLNNQRVVDYIIHKLTTETTPQEVKALAEDRWKEVETKQAENARSAGWSESANGWFGAGVFFAWI